MNLFLARSTWPRSWPNEPRALSSPSVRRRQRRLRRLLASATGARLVFALADRVLRPVDGATAAAQLRAVTSGRLDGLSVVDQGMLRLAGAAAQVAPCPGGNAGARPSSV